MLAPVVLGLAQGAQHSLEPDHLAAVAVMIGDRRGVRGSAWLGAMWGLGHTLALAAMCLALAHLGATLPAAADRAFALLVAATLIVLGVRALRPPPADAPPRAVRSPAQAFVVGALHGLAGSSALTALVFTALPTWGARLAYVGLFGLGSVLGMAVVSGAAAAGLRQVARPRLLVALRIAIAATSIAIGLATAASAVGLRA